MKIERVWGDAWGDSWGELASDPWVEEGIGLAPVSSVAPPAVDFVVQPYDWYSRHTLKFRNTLMARSVVNMEAARAARQEKTELKEMIELYAQWKKAA